MPIASQATHVELKAEPSEARPSPELAFLHVLKLESGCFALRPIPGGRWAGVKSFMTTYAILVGQIGDLVGYEDRWCYENEALALAALEAWSGEGEPEGWHRHPVTGRRRPKGDAGREYVQA